MAMKGLGWRLAALIWMVSIGAILASIVIIIGFLYGVVNIVSRALGQGPVLGPGNSLKVYVFFTDAITWWANLLYYAITGAGEGFDPIPPLPG